MRCGWLESVVIDFSDGENVDRARALSAKVRKLCQEATERGESPELVVAALDLATRHETAIQDAECCNRICETYMAKLSRAKEEAAETLAGEVSTVDEIMEREG